ncbi:MAG: twin-arginine translocation pathway signal [Methylocystis sp.]|nr:MAG: twin-arginine translocation pathway signal [Methylocystis sp.]
MLTRRQTIARLGATGAALALPRAPEASEAPDYALPDWTGDSAVPMHAIRDGAWDRPLPAPERRVEIAIVGGGLAGLSAAALLSERDLLLFERERETGGVARGGRWRDVDYALGSAYFVDLTEPYGAFYDMLGVAPRPVPEPVDRLLDPGGSDRLRGELRKPHAEFLNLIAKLVASGDFPDLPIEAAPAAALALDRMTLADFLRREHVDPRLLDFIDVYCLSAMGAPAAEVSAYAGLNFLSEFAGKIHALPGGNAALARAMLARIDRAGAGRIVSNAAVFAIEPSEGGEARVGWFDATNPGEAHCISARWVVVAAPYFFAARILRGAGTAAVRMRSLRQGSFLVANCCFEGRTPAGPYDSWAPGARAFTDAVDATAALPPERRPKDHNVLTVYAPFRDPGLGRAQLLAGDRAALAAPIIAELRALMPDAFSQARLAEVRLTRWGHHHLIAAPGTIEAMRTTPKRFGNVLLAHSDGQGMPAVESAIMEAHRAVATIKAG